jgi:MFS family permease
VSDGGAQAKSSLCRNARRFPLSVPAPVSTASPRLIWLLLSLMVAMVLAALDQSIVATALPVIAGELNGVEAMSWVVTLFMLTSTISAPLYGKLSDLYGQRPLFMVCIVVFVGASALCGLASSMTELILFRGLQGLGAGGLMTLSQVAMMLLSSFVGGSISARRQNFQTLLAIGVGLECLGLSLLLLWAHLGMGAGYFFVTMGILGMGMGIGMPNATVIVQNSVPSRMMGAATASMAFCRSLGGALGVAAAGGIMSYTLGRELAQLPEAFRHLNLLEGLGEALAGPPEQIAQLTELYRGAIQASLSAGGLVMFAAFLLVLSLRWAKAPDSP